MEKIKIVHVAVVDGTPEHIAGLREQLIKVKDRLNYPVEFLITNDRVELKDVRKLIDDLYELYRSYKNTKETKNGKKE